MSALPSTLQRNNSLCYSLSDLLLGYIQTLHMLVPKKLRSCAAQLDPLLFHHIFAATN